MKKSSKKKRLSKYLIPLSILFSALVLFIIVYDIFVCRNKNKIILGENNEQNIMLMLSTGEKLAKSDNIDMVDAITEIIKKDFDTSASEFCFVALDDELAFFRDDNATKKSAGEEYRSFFDLHRTAVPLDNACRNSYLIRWNNENWIISVIDKKTEYGVISLGICINEIHFNQNSYFETLMQHVIVILILFITAFITVTIYLVAREKNNTKIEKELNDQLRENRLLIEKLGVQIEEQSDVDTKLENGICSKRTVQSVIEKLTIYQRSKCKKILIDLNKSEQYLIVRYSVLLDSLNGGKYIACLWEENQFMVLLLNCDNENAENFVKQIILQYQRMFLSDVKNVTIRIENLGEENEI